MKTRFSDVTSREVLSCPLCGHQDLRRQGRRPLDVEFNRWIAVCAGCSLHVTDPMATPEALEQYYSQQYGTHQLPCRPDIRSNSKLTADAVAVTQLHGGPGRFLDIGCASGEVIWAMGEQGWDCQGIELSKSFVQHAREEYGLDNILLADPTDVELEPNSFDRIHFWHVIEHLPDPLEVLRLAAHWLKPETGILNLGMPLAGTWVQRASGWVTGRYSGSVGKAHTFGFTAAAARRACSQAGLDIHEHRLYGNDLRRLRWLYRALPESWIGSMQALTLKKP